MENLVKEQFFWNKNLSPISNTEEINSLEHLKKLRQYTLKDAIENTWLLLRCCLIGIALIFVDSLLELIISPFGFFSLIISILMLILSAFIQDDNPNAFISLIILLSFNYITEIYLHQIISFFWISGIGFIGYIIFNITSSIALFFLIIISIAGSVNKDPIYD